MYIERVQVEEGFLDGLDLTFTPGLNVIIGERGTGKSSLIELVRFCLNAKGHTGVSSRRSSDHAISVLKGGQVIVTLRDGDEKIIVSRSVDQDVPDITGAYVPPIVFSQSEIETVGLDAAGRLRIIDGFVSGAVQNYGEEVNAVSTIRSLTNEAYRIRQDIIEHEDRLAKLPEIVKQIKELEPDEKKVAKVSSEAAAKTKKLEVLTQKMSKVSVDTDYMTRFRNAVAEWEAEARAFMSNKPAIEEWANEENPDPLLGPKREVAVAAKCIIQALEAIEAAGVGVGNSLKKASVVRQELENQSRSLRAEVEALQAGAGEIVRRGQKLREEKGQLEAIQKVVAEKKKNLSAILERRSEALYSLEDIRQKRFARRDQAAELLSKILAPRIRVDVTHAEQTESYAAVIADALKGSGLKYNELASNLANVISPRELIDLTDENDGEELAEVASISKDRAFKVLASLREADLGDLASIELEDEVRFQLLDGGDYKSFAELSTGQRCTVILPIILEHRERILMLDQPEDHIDNAFIADTLISAIARRSSAGQMLLSTHNANIPVLGGAERVIHLGSDGRRGFVQTGGSLDDSNVVDAITAVMEGGVEAFRQRAAFYKAHSHG